ncbi:MAG: YceI family protein, partial [Gammaproteobacteria bacterium]|nr:YceI family protein [Gammaproteobacteria bacterium]
AVGLMLAGALAGAPSLAAAACWVPVPAANSIVFNTTQAGAPFQGQFTQFSGRVCLSTNAAEPGLIRVQVQAASVDTGLPELDDALRGPDFFDVARWPQASFVSESVKALDTARYQATGKLTLRDVTRTITVPFSFTPTAGGGARLQGTLDFERLDYHIGLGQWQDTRWVGNEVDVKFSVLLKPAGSNAPAAPAGRRNTR